MKASDSWTNSGYSHLRSDLNERREPTQGHRHFECMPRYFFNTYHDRTQLDEEGEELLDHDAAWKEATVSAGQILQSIDGNLKPGQD